MTAIAKSVLVHRQGLRPGARSPTCPPATPLLRNRLIETVKEVAHY